MTKINGSDAMLQVLVDWDIDHIFGYPGGSFDSTMNAILNFKDKLKFIEVRHEEAGALAASAEYKLTGKVGVCFGSAGPGAVHLMNGLYDAKYDKTPMVAIIANVPTSRQDMNFFQAFDEKPWFDNVAVWNHQVKAANQIPRMMDEALRQAYAKKGPAVLILPKDFGWDKINYNFQVTANSLTAMPNYAAPIKESVDEAVKLIAEATNPVVYFGMGLKGHGDVLKAFSDKFKMPLMSSVIAKGIVEDAFPAYLGSIGRCAPKASDDIQTHADLVVWVGNDSPFSSYFFNPKAKMIQIDIDSEKLGKRHTVDLPILADGAKTLQAIIDAGEAREESPLYKAGVEDRKNWEEWQHSFDDADEMPIRREPIFDIINKYAADDAMFGIDVGNINIDFQRLMNLHDNQVWATSGLYATMGFGSPAAVAAATACPDREVWNLGGDGGFAMMSQELLTQARYNMHIMNVVFTNETLGFIQAEQEDQSHQPLSGVILPDNDWAKVAEGMNVKGVTVRTKQEFEDAVKEWKSSDKPMLVDVKLTHEMPYSTELNTLDDPAFVEKYQAQGLKPFSYFAEKYGVNDDAFGPVDEDDATSGASEA
ncbi:pyruvate oxidase [Lactobacillus sp. ESL0731]|uniref:pyruvate oxidase n=1 Tax=unclassified Lactobacillus TaxID=2620435 RepID=UPI0023FA1E00|nr:MULTISPECIES: pyruvate oxidase [unclassified Lactobacillus]WEV51142.1 pyruvate oxidase [Lactobacillus sp. ESL0700]WEV62270.1 pyruvate oxidase [Lactobacillus sp. ESL0731]